MAAELVVLDAHVVVAGDLKDLVLAVPSKVASAAGSPVTVQWMFLRLV